MGWKEVRQSWEEVGGTFCRASRVDQVSCCQPWSLYVTGQKNNLWLGQIDSFIHSANIYRVPCMWQEFARYKCLRRGTKQGVNLISLRRRARDPVDKGSPN